MLAAAVPKPRAKATGSSEAWQRYEIEQQLQAPAPLEQTPRARAIREINRIALRRGWGSEVAKVLDEAGVSYLSELQDHEIEDLAARMRHLVDCAASGCDPEDDFAAR